MSMNRRNIVFHVGYPKAASTTLQKSLFNAHKEIANLGIYPKGNVGRDSNGIGQCKAPIMSDVRIRKFYRMLTQEDGVLFDQRNAEKLWRSLLADYGIEKSTIVFSSEQILSSRFANPEIVEKARRIKQLCSEAKILIIVRSQLNMLRSLYRDHPFDPRSIGYRPRPVNFSDWLKIDFQLPYSSLSNTLLFNRVVSIYESLFSKEQVLVLPLELLNKKRGLFINQLSLFMEIDMDEAAFCLENKYENKGVSNVGNRYRRFRNALAPYVKSIQPSNSFLKKIDRNLFSILRDIGSTEEIKISQSDMSLILDKFSTDNGILARQRKLPLEELGYPFSEF